MIALPPTLSEVSSFLVLLWVAWLPTRLLLDATATALAPQPVVPLPQVTAPMPPFHKLLETT